MVDAMQNGPTRKTAPADRSASGLADDRRRATWLNRAILLVTVAAGDERGHIERLPSRHGFTIL